MKHPSHEPHNAPGVFLLCLLLSRLHPLFEQISNKSQRETDSATVAPSFSPSYLPQTHHCQKDHDNNTQHRDTVHIIPPPRYPEPE
jgi:hypothetical protein